VSHHSFVVGTGGGVIATKRKTSLTFSANSHCAIPGFQIYVSLTIFFSAINLDNFVNEYGLDCFQSMTAK